MNPKFLFILITLSILLTGRGVIACDPDSSPGSATEIPTPPDNNGNNNENNPHMQIRVRIGIAIYTATLTGNNTAAAFKAMLPLTLNMNDVNRNEKFIRLSQSLPTAASNPGTIRAGDLMLYGSDGLVLFYKTFTTSYSYTCIGSIDNPAGLESAIGTANIPITFEQYPNNKTTCEKKY